MIASQVGFRLGLGLASPKRKGTRRQLVSLIRIPPLETIATNTSRDGRQLAQLAQEARAEARYRPHSRYQ